MTAPLNTKREPPYKLAGLILALITVTVVVLAYMQFRGDFLNREQLTMISSRAGLSMDPGAKVTYNGVEIGRVGKVQAVSVGDQPQAKITLDVDPNLPNPRSDGRHRLPVVRVQSVLDTAELESGEPACQRREGPQVTPSAAEQDERLVRHCSRVADNTSFCISGPVGDRRGQASRRLQNASKRSRVEDAGTTHRVGGGSTVPPPPISLQQPSGFLRIGEDARGARDDNQCRGLNALGREVARHRQVDDCADFAFSRVSGLVQTRTRCSRACRLGSSISSA